MLPRFCYYRLALQPKMVEKIEADRVWAVAANELATKLNLNKQRDCHKTIERKIPQAYLLEDFSQYPKSTQLPIADDYILKPGDKLHIKLVPTISLSNTSAQNQQQLRNSYTCDNTTTLTEEHRILQICFSSEPSKRNSRTTPYQRRRDSQQQSLALPKTTGIPKSMQKKYLEQTYK